MTQVSIRQTTLTVNNLAPVCLLRKLVTNPLRAWIKLGRGEKPHLVRKTSSSLPLPTHQDVHSHLSKPQDKNHCYHQDGRQTRPEVASVLVALSPTSTQPWFPLGQAGLGAVTSSIRDLALSPDQPSQLPLTLALLQGDWEHMSKGADRTNLLHQVRGERPDLPRLFLLAPWP